MRARKKVNRRDQDRKNKIRRGGHPNSVRSVCRFGADRHKYTDRDGVRFAHCIRCGHEDKTWRKIPATKEVRTEIDWRF